MGNKGRKKGYSKTDFDILNKELREVDFGVLRERIMDEVEVRDILGDFNVDVGYSNKILCPLPDHDESTPSFFINDAKNVFKCFGCHRGGGVVELYMHLKQIPQKEAMLEIADKYKIDKTFKNFKPKKEEKKIFDREYFRTLRKESKEDIVSREVMVLNKVKLHAHQLPIEKRVKAYELSDMIYLGVIKEEYKLELIEELDKLF